MVYIHVLWVSLEVRARQAEELRGASHRLYSQSASVLDKCIHDWNLIRIQLPETVQDRYREVYGEAASENVLRFLRTQLMQAIWLLLLCPEFMHAYVHGILEKCGDGIWRRLFPRLFEYSADYPEK